MTSSPAESKESNYAPSGGPELSNFSDEPSGVPRSGTTIVKSQRLLLMISQRYAKCGGWIPCEAITRANHPLLLPRGSLRTTIDRDDVVVRGEGMEVKRP